MTAPDDLLAQLTQALAESNEALTAISQAQQHSATAAETFEHTIEGSNLPEVTQAAAETRTTAGATLALAATTSTAINDLQSYLDRLTGGRQPTRLTATAAVSGEELVKRPAKRSFIGELADEATEHLEDVEEQSGKLSDFIRQGIRLHAPDLAPPPAAHAETGHPVAGPVGGGVSNGGASAPDPVSTLAVATVIAVQGGGLVFNRLKNKLKEWKRDHR